MKQISIVFTFFLVAAFYGCSTTNFNSNSNILPTCAANLTSENESQEKQCCLKDSLNLIIKQDLKICQTEEKLDSTSQKLLNKSIADSVKNKIDNQIKNEIQNKVVNQTRSECTNNSCGNSNVFIKNIINTGDGKKKKNRNWDEILELLKEKGWRNLLLLTLIYLFPLFLGIIVKIYLFLKRFAILTFLVINEGNIPFIKKFFRKVCNCISGLLKGLKSIIKKFLNIRIYNALSPTDDANISNETLKQLKFSIIDENDKIKNIAITGPYGSGKSSVWSTFKKRYCLLHLKNIVEISLATFCEKQENKIIYASTETEIEQAIIQQLTFSRKKDVLKYSFFPKIYNLTNLKTSFLTTLFLIFASIILFCTNNTLFDFIISWILAPSLLGVFYIFLVFSIVYKVIFVVIQKFNKLRISKICIKEIELTLAENSSYFNKFINEIVYFFEATKCNCVVFEDLDRLNTPKIFVKLRELNTLLNNYPAIKGKIKFIYLIKDDMLAKYERTKFFDYIIPVIPTLSVNNAASIFRRELNNLSDKILLDDEYLISIQDFLKDLRLLKNSINEFYIYRDEIKNIKRELLDYEIHAILNKQDTTYIDKLINKKLFSIILYKNLFPKDFSNLEKNEGVLFDILNLIDENLLNLIDDDHSKINEEILINYINNKRESARESFSKQPIKEILTNNNSSKLRGIFKKIVEILNKDWELKGKECVDPDLLMNMLANGYIENDYEMYIKKYDDSILNYKEQTFLLNVKNDIPASKDLDLRDDKIQLICKNIQNYQWNSPGVINEKIVDNIIQSNKTDDDNKVEGIVEAMFAYDSTQPQKFIPQYFEHCQIENIDTTPILKKIDTILGKSNEEKCIRILGCFFYDTDINIFIEFLKSVKRDLSIYDPGPTIGKFIDGSEASFKDKLSQYSDFDLLISTMEDDGIRIALTPEICKKLVKNNKLTAKIFRINKDNIDLILKEFNLTTEEQNYLTRCLTIKGLKEVILDNYTYPFFNRILSKFEEVDEDYSAILAFFESNKKSTFNIATDKKRPYIIKLAPKWEKFVLYNHFISFDDYLSESIKKFMALNNSNQEISDSLKKDESSIKEFIRAVIKEPKLDISILNDIFLPYWRKYVPSILSCYNGEEQEIQNLPQDRNNLLQVNAIVYESNYLGQVMLDLVIQDPEYFELNYPEEDYEKDSEFRLLVLDSKAENIDKIKRRFFEKIVICPTKNEDARRHRIYINAGHHLQNDTAQNYNTLFNGITEICHDIDSLRDFDKHSLNSYSVNQTFDFADTWFKETSDPLSILLVRTFMHWFNKLTDFIKNNSVHRGNEIQCLKDNISNDIIETNKKIKEYKNLIQMIDLWIDEMKRYAQTFLPF